MQTNTPRTDAAAFGTDDESLNRLFGIRELPRYVVPVDFARQLERELAAVTADLEFRRELGALQQQEYDKVTAERDALQKEVELVIGFQDREADAKRKAFADLSASQQEARRLREALDAIMASAKVAYCATTDPMMTDALVGIGKRCKDAIDAELARKEVSS